MIAVARKRSQRHVQYIERGFVAPTCMGRFIVSSEMEYEAGGSSGDSIRAEVKAQNQSTAKPRRARLTVFGKISIVTTAQQDAQPKKLYHWPLFTTSKSLDSNQWKTGNLFHHDPVFFEIEGLPHGSLLERSFSPYGGIKLLYEPVVQIDVTTEFGTSSPQAKTSLAESPTTSVRSLEAQDMDEQHEVEQEQSHSLIQYMQQGSLIPICKGRCEVLSNIEYKTGGQGDDSITAVVAAQSTARRVELTVYAEVSLVSAQDAHMRNPKKLHQWQLATSSNNLVGWNRWRTRRNPVTFEVKGLPHGSLLKRSHSLYDGTKLIYEPWVQIDVTTGFGSPSPHVKTILTGSPTSVRDIYQLPHDHNLHKVVYDVPEVQPEHPQFLGRESPIEPPTVHSDEYHSPSLVSDFAGILQSDESLTTVHSDEYQSPSVALDFAGIFGSQTVHSDESLTISFDSNESPTAHSGSCPHESLAVDANLAGLPEVDSNESPTVGTNYSYVLPDSVPIICRPCVIIVEVFQSVCPTGDKSDSDLTDTDSSGELRDNNSQHEVEEAIEVPYIPNICSGAVRHQV